MTQEEAIITLPIETYSNTSSSSNYFVKEQRYNRTKQEQWNIVMKDETRNNFRLLKKPLHFSQKELSPKQFREKFLKRLNEYNENNSNKEDSIPLKKKNTQYYISESFTMLNKENSYYDLSDISSLNLNSSKEEGSDDEQYEINFEDNN